MIVLLILENFTASLVHQLCVFLKVEDIVDTGNTLNCLIEHLKAKKASSVSVCTLLDKPSRRKVHFKLVGKGRFYSGFEVSCFLFLSVQICIIIIGLSKGFGIEVYCFQNLSI